MKTYVHLSYCAEFFLRMRNVSDRSYREDQNTFYNQ
jgi:hypothetical protein